jgi:hypothetical protein
MDIQVFSTRETMIRHYLKEGMVGCELGVFAGEFAESLVRKLPKHLTLIDSWSSEEGMLFSGDVDGNNGVSLPQEQLYGLVVSRFAENPRVKILRGWTWEMIPTIPDFSLDYVYIDADHSYEGMKRDLKLIEPKLKPDGFLMGHDYEMNFAKANYPWKFGVQQAVDEFCKDTDYKLIAKGMDGCVSFCLQRRLDSFSSSTSTPANL